VPDGLPDRAGIWFRKKENFLAHYIIQPGSVVKAFMRNGHSSSLDKKSEIVRY
jgi:hypothetical protein